MEIINVNAEQVRNNIISNYEAETGKQLAPADPVRLLLNTETYIALLMLEAINQAAKQNLPRYAHGETLEAIAELVGVTRLSATGASVTVKFTLSAPQASVFTIPAGTRVSAGGDIYFATDEVAYIAIGQLEVNVKCTCLTAGVVGNGYIPSQINTLVDQLAYATSVSNITTSSGGTNQESDSALFARMQDAPHIPSTAGSEEAYKYWTKTAHVGIADVQVYSPEPRIAQIVVLMQDGELPSIEVLDTVEGVLNDPKIKPLTDLITIKAPTEVSYTINFTYYIDGINANDALTIQSQVNKAVTEYIAWQRAKIGRDINQSELISRVMQAGARRVVITQPTYTDIERDELAVIEDIEEDVTVTYGGVEYD